MCATCGCSEAGGAVLTDVQTGERFLMHDDHEHPLGHTHGEHPHHDHEHHHHHSHDHGHTHAHAHVPTTLHLQERVLAKNDLLAERNRGWFEGRNVLALNLVSSPGAGKTTLLERTIRDLGGERPLAVIEGDQETTRDADRIRAAGCRAVQINTGAGCHLDAAMVGRGLKQLDPPAGAVVFIENVGNLVCPALFDLGERAKVVIVSVTEGDDKPLKYPHVFRASRLMLVNKLDLLPYVAFDLDRCVANARRVNPDIRAIPVSATAGTGMADWYAWVRGECGSDRPG